MVQKLIKGFLARKNYEWRKKNPQELQKIFAKIIWRDSQYLYIQGFLNKSKIFLSLKYILAQDLVLTVYDISKKIEVQKCLIVKNDYISILKEEEKGDDMEFEPNSDKTLNLKPVDNLNDSSIDFAKLIEEKFLINNGERYCFNFMFCNLILFNWNIHLVTKLYSLFSKTTAKR